MLHTTAQSFGFRLNLLQRVAFLETESTRLAGNYNAQKKTSTYHPKADRQTLFSRRNKRTSNDSTYSTEHNNWYVMILGATSVPLSQRPPTYGSALTS